ncbi:unnamed protein product [Rotaria sordida]|uniref:C-CAP/cofactor C-like domain-containing protein n=1 Tax=Rotaria sordida TaxID=392033 RepID=A0A819ET73_9BILA|nr:unnamed protein product [Rotaria sordida]CAF1117114.1 unnamed protein product [Rotaria sordida]CAF3857098.1 unnamed protein product [Rotaria sordida]CAF3885329.1 unnamed protein product [Rotaria sordida]
MDSHVKRFDNLNNRLESVANQLQSSVGKTGTGHKNSSNENLDNLPVLRDYNAIINDSFASFVTMSRKIGGELSITIDHVTRLFDAQREFLRQAIQIKKPTNDQQIAELIKPQSNEIETIVAFTNKNRKSTLFNHLSSISEGIPAFGWILVSPTPAPHIKEMLDAAQFYANRVLKDFKEKDPIHAEWVKQWIKILNELHAYVKQYHTTGLTWGTYNQRDASTFVRNPPPPTSSLSNMQIDDSSSQTGIMNSINGLGTNATVHLKKVPDELKVHKNPNLKEQPIERSNKFQMNTSNTSTNTTSGPPKLALEGNKWIVEYQNGRTDLKITETNMRHTIYIYKCSNSTIIIQGKVNSIVLDQCTKVGIQFTSVVSLIEFINCRQVKAQVLENVPTIQIEKTDGCHIYLSKSSLNTEFITSKSSEMTINVPFGDGEYKEYPIPEQFKTCLRGGKQLVTVPNESSGV